MCLLCRTTVHKCRFLGGEVPRCLLFARTCWYTIVPRHISSQGVAVYDLVMDMDTATVRQGLVQGRLAHKVVAG